MPISLPSGAVGSGLILLVIVAAWLAVLVPMALRSSESPDSLSSVDRFSDAMRVLARRDAAAKARARAVAGPERLGEPDPDDLDDLEDDLRAWEPEREPLLARVGTALAPVTGVLRRLPRALPRRRAGRRPLTAAARRRRLLVVLLAASAATLAAGLLLWPPALVAHGVADLALVGYVVALRRTVLARQARSAARRPVRRPADTPAAPPAGSPAVSSAVVAAPDAVVAAPDAVDAEPDAVDAEPVAEPVVAVARHDEPMAAPLGLGLPWSPVPVPPPVYASKPPAARTRTVDLTRPGAYTEAVAAGERLPGMEDEPAAVPRPVEPRRAVNDW